MSARSSGETVFTVPLSDHETEVVATRLDVDQDVEGLAAVLSDDERARAARFVLARDRHRFIVGRARLREQLGLRLGIPPARVELVYGPYGKPALAPRQAQSDVHFNVSHAGDLAVFAITQGRPVGVDIEAVRELPDADAVAARMFSGAEIDAYQRLEPNEKARGFFNCWTRKEAFVKAIGEGLSHPLDRFDVTVAPGEPARILRVGTTPGDSCGWILHSFSPAPGFVGALVARCDVPA